MKISNSAKNLKGPVGKKASTAAGVTFRGGEWSPSITESHYTPQEEHPEDRIHRDREYIHRLQAHIDEVYDTLEKDLGIKEGKNWLFDFIYNEDKGIEFEDYLRECKVQYNDIVDQRK